MMFCHTVPDATMLEHVAVAYGLLLLEVIVNIVVIHRVKYTEIDWIAYMQVKLLGISLIT